MERNPGRESFVVKEGSRYVGGWWGESIDAEDDYDLDHRLRRLVRTFLDQRADIDPSRIEVLVFNCSVILGGTVKNTEVRDRLLTDVKNLPHVREVNNGLKVEA
jgi:osmotically-inducible protein OsmY